MELLSPQEVTVKILGFTHPLLLLLLLGIVPLVLWSRSSNADLEPWRRNTVLYLRIAIYSLIVLALAGMRIYLPTRDLSVVFMVDDSSSTPSTHRIQAMNYIEESLRYSHYNDKVQVALFGDDVYLDQVLENSRSTAPFSTLVRQEHTNISQALSFAEAVLPRETRRRIVLISDGNENRGSASSEGLLAGASDTEIWTVPYRQQQKQEVLIHSLHLPEKCALDEPFDLGIVIESTTATEARMKVFQNGSPVAAQRLSLHAGENVFYVPQVVKSAGTYAYEVSIECRDDFTAKNNQATAVTFVQGKPRVLYVSDFESPPGPIPGLLKSAGLDVVEGDPRALPTDLAGLNAYQSIIFGNLSALSLAPKQMSAIKSYVQDLGGGFVMIGGTNSFGIGGYYGTPVEEILPVSMDVRKKKKLPVTALILVIDKSGSMGDTAGGDKQKIVLAREAAIVTLEVLAPQDIIGVIAFDSASKWVSVAQQAKNKNAIIAEIGALKAGGGTSLYPALDSALFALNESKAAIKHIIVLSDGRTEPGNFDRLTDESIKHHITLSTVSVGRDADLPFMEGLAKKGKGRSYYTDDASLLPRIFLKDTFIASQSAVLEEPFRPAQCESHAALSGIDLAHAPELRGYCITAEKPLSNVILTSHKKDPVLAMWRTGLGKSLAFTSDEGEKWARAWLSWREFRPFWLQLIRWTLPSLQNDAYSVTTRLEGERCHVSLEALDEEGNYLNFLHFGARVITPDMESFEIPFRQRGPGSYGADFETPRPGNYLVNIRERGGQGQVIAVTVPYSPEYRDFRTNSFLLNRLAELSGGKYDPKPGEIFTPPRKKAYIPHDTWERLLMLALLLFPFDVGLRRIFLPPGWYHSLFGLAGQLKGKSPETVAPSSTLSALKTRKQEVAQHFAADPGSTIEEPEPVTSKVADRVEGKDTGPSLAQEAPDKKTTLEAETKPALSQDTLTYLERLKQAKRKAGQ
jgi:Mg-chelatase subunit ChlD